MNKRVLRYLDLSGYAFSGKHAVSDLMREFDGYCVPHFQFEFNLLRIQGGIRDLETALVDDWSPIRSDAALRRFNRLIKRFGTKNSWVKPSSWFNACGWNYDVFFNGQFLRLSRKYIEELTAEKWRTDWPYTSGDLDGVSLFFRKLLKLAGLKRATQNQYRLACPTDFIEITRKYLNKLMCAFGEGNHHAIVMHNSLEPFNPTRALRYFYDAKCIIVDRDPRDIYVAQHSYIDPGSKRKKPKPYRPVAVRADAFVKRFFIYHRFSENPNEDENRILRLRFEDLVLNYEETLNSIYGFLDESAESHLQRGIYFRPEVSRKNIGIWRGFKDQGAINYIREHLENYCVEV